MGKLKTILFDLGGVVIDLYPERTFQAFGDVLQKDPDSIMQWYNQADFFRLYEKGLISDAAFREQIKSYTSLSITDAAIDQAWSAMLGDIPAERIGMIRKLSPHYKLMVLSNTNAIHIAAFNQILKQSCGYDDLGQLFDYVYYSYILHMRKPDHEIYRFVIEQHEHTANEILFLEDTPANIEAAKRMNLQTLLIEKTDVQIESLTKQLNGAN